jgi:hypothetical protein
MVSGRLWGVNREVGYLIPKTANGAKLLSVPNRAPAQT